jgi:hypothetical protein
MNPTFGFHLPLELRRYIRAAFSRCVFVVLVSVLAASQPTIASAQSLLARENIVPWELYWVRGEAEVDVDVRARMLADRGIRRYALAYRPGKLATLEAEISALNKRGIEITAVYFWLDAERPGEDPELQAAFESFKRLRIHPRIWVSQSSALHPKTLEDWKKALGEAGFNWVDGQDNFGSAFSSRTNFTDHQKESFFKALHRVYSEEAELPSTPHERTQRLVKETERIGSLARLASNYGFSVELYNHNGWFGLMENQVAIIERLHRENIKNVRIVYTFWHARDALHDDVKDFEEVWKKIMPHVGMVAIRGVRGEMESLYPSQGSDELRMLRIIHSSGWKGRVGVLCLDPGVDPDVVLANTLRGIGWLAAELDQPGSGGAPPLSAGGMAHQ